MKNKKSKNKKKIKNLLLKVIIAITVMAVIGIGVYYFLTAEDEESNLTLLEKQWIEKNKTTLIDIKVPNNIYAFSESGEGALFTFLDSFEENTGLAFNKTPYNYPIENNDKDDSLSFLVLKNSDKIRKDDILVFEDNYVLLSKNEAYLNDLRDISGSRIGILNSDSASLSSDNFGSNITLSNYASVTELLTAIQNGIITYGAIPRYTYLEDIVTTKGIFVNYSFNNLSNKVVLRLGKNERLNNILTKSLNNWLDRHYEEDFEKQLMAFYEQTVKITELEKSTLTSRIYKYGYVKNVAYNVERQGKIYGVAGEYINVLSNMINMEFEYIEYDSNEALTKALEKGSIDVAYVDFEYKTKNDFITSSPFMEKIVALSDNYLNIDDKNGLINKKLLVLKNSYLEDYFINSNYNVSTFKSYSDTLANDYVMVLDANDYLYLKDSSLVDYKYLFTDTSEGNYNFVVTEKNEVLYNLLNFVLNNTDYNTCKTKALNSLLDLSVNQSSFKEVYFIFLAIILLPIIVVLLSIVIIKNSKKLKISKKENILRYNDVLTNLKNRNYLNDNIEKWDDMKVFPRTIIIIDLNNLKYVNDNYGHEEGNELIKQAGAILISTQLEKSEIVRSDGNEFLIYLIGYSKNQVATYISKLSKEFEHLPYGFGAALGYSVIDDEIKTVDDAINEATIAMRMDKEQNYR